MPQTPALQKTLLDNTILRIKIGFACLFFPLATFEYTPFVMVQLKGQLGNVLFQIATASALAWDHNCHPCLYEPNPTSPIFEHVLSRFGHATSKKDVRFEWNEPGYAYHPILFFPNMCIDGYFQSEKYFAHHRNEILELFSPTAFDLNYMQEKYGWLIHHPNTVGIQLRYYQSEFPKGSSSPFPQYGLDFLEKATALFHEDSLFIVSSNDLDFARKNIPSHLKNVVYLENEPNYIDLFLLSFCKHNIITNSSFGWWSAWLNQNPNKVVVCPEVWIFGLPTQDVRPREWKTIHAEYDE